MTPTPSPQHTSAATRRVTFLERSRDRLLRPGRHWVWTSVATYVLACVLPAHPPIMGGDSIPGYVCLACLLYWYPPWWANPIYFVAVIAALLTRLRIAIVFAIVAAVLAMSYELMVFYDQGGPRVMEHLLPGCLLWIASMQLLACNCMWQQWLDWQRRQECLDRGADESKESSSIQSTARQRSDPAVH
jgi:hypothetical protein